MTIACARAYQAFHEEIYLQQAEKHFNLVFDRAWSDDLGGGLFWRIENTTKNACINGPAAIAACYIRLPKIRVIWIVRLRFMTGK